MDAAVRAIAPRHQVSTDEWLIAICVRTADLGTPSGLFSHQIDGQSANDLSGSVLCLPRDIGRAVHGGDVQCRLSGFSVRRLCC